MAALPAAFPSRWPRGAPSNARRRACFPLRKSELRNLMEDVPHYVPAVKAVAFGSLAGFHRLRTLISLVVLCFRFQILGFHPGFSALSAPLTTPANPVDAFRGNR